MKPRGFAVVLLLAVGSVAAPTATAGVCEGGVNHGYPCSSDDDCLGRCDTGGCGFPGGPCDQVCRNEFDCEFSSGICRECEGPRPGTIPCRFNIECPSGGMIVGTCTAPPPGVCVPSDTPVPAGRVPATLLLEKDPWDVEALILSWGTSCASSDLDYEIYIGELGTYYSHGFWLCSTGGATTHYVRVRLDLSTYFLVVPRNDLQEGSYGLRSGGLERPPAPSPRQCVRQSIADPCL